jgi:hypothetical protein
MATIDIGAGATDRASSGGRGFTIISFDNPANDTGTLTSFEVWISGNSGAEHTFFWGTFYGSGTDYTRRGKSADLGNISAGSKQTFTGQSVEVSTGDFIGFYLNNSNIYSVEADTTGGARRYKAGNQFDAGTQTYSAEGTQLFSLYATGATVAAGSLPLKNVFGRPFSGVFR